MKELGIYFKGYVKEAFLGPLFKLLEAGFELVVPLIMASLIDQIIPKEDQSGLVLLVFYLFLLAGIGALIAIVAQYVSAKAAVGYTNALTDALFAKVLRLPQSEKDRLGESSLLTRLSADTFQIQTGINLFLRLFLRAPIIVVGAILMAVRISPKVSGWFLGMVILLIGIVFAISRVTAPLYQRTRQTMESLVFLTREQVSGMRVVRAFGQRQREEEAFTKENQLYTNRQLTLGAWSAALAPLTYLIVNLSLLGLMWQGNQLVRHSLLSQGMLIALVNYLLQILTELLKAATLVTNLNQSYISARRVKAVFEAEEEDLSAPLALESLPEHQALMLKEVGFTYPGAAAPALEGISVDLEQGGFLGIIGGTGSGKTTLVQLLSGLRSPSQGKFSLTYKGQPVPDLQTWRNWVAVVPQKAQLFKGTIRENLLMGLSPEKYSDSDLWQALEIAQASDFVHEKEGGLEAEVSAFGRNFSGGQRQRLTIARALLRQAPFLILDDATSALDYLTEARLLAALKQSTGLQTLILVSQRTRSLQAADAILVLEKGRQVALGDHEHLMADATIYRSIHLSQHKEQGGSR
ncbi:ABC transporter ATP-binding protein [Streptococcus ovuberis]|uniref:ABC transporter ATP-binding protein n=1 Tax=Streptococcus ovuberis TaxID=1936207 RepID=A0A7X6MYW3_9STRE|nr:ABC transporter ATP-binding protein [Streptococcus ovuberis]NKZ20925.1 ABC transporter ATP-binding protein [Streptococcus ovuberis]